MKSAIFIFVLFLCFCSCAIIRTPGLFCGYNRLSEIEKSHIIFIDQDFSICNLPVIDSNMYAVNGSQLRNCLVHNDTSLIYFWSPHCGSSYCISIAACQEYCNAKNYQLYIVADYYEIEPKLLQNNTVSPIFVANHTYYNRRYVNGINKRFRTDLLGGQHLDKEDQYKRFFLFKTDSLVHAMPEIE
jgi:hypothetical protein